MADDALGQIISGVAAILTPVVVATTGLWVWSVKRRRLRREQIEAKRARRRRALRAAQAKAPEPVLSSARLDEIRSETLEELRKRAIEAESDLERVRGERDDLATALESESEEHLKTRGRLQECQDEVTNVRRLAQSSVSGMEIRLKAVELSLAEIRGRERGLDAYARQVAPRAEAVRNENLRLLALLPAEVRDAHPELGESLHQIPVPPTYLLAPVDDDSGTT